MSFPAYPQYKDSGVSWAKSIPSHWGELRLAALFELQKREVQPDHEVVTAFRDGQVTLRSNRREDGFMFATKEIGYQGVAVGDLVIHAMDAFAGAIGVSDSSGKSTPVYSVCMPKSEVDARFYALLLRTMALSGFVESLAKGVRERSTDFRWRDARDVRVPVPPFSEQRAIVAFIEGETAKIDAAVAAQERLIALLAEKRAATISHAVTKGLDPDAPTKDSGIEWLGQIPAHWSTPAISHVCNEIGSGTTPSTNDEQAYGGEVCWVTTGELRETGIYSTRKRLTEAALANYSALRKFPPGTLLIAMYGATIGRLGWLECEAATNQACCAMQTSEPYLSRFLFYVLQGGKSALILLGSGGGQPNISQEKVRQFRFALPPHEELESILNHLDSACSQIDGLHAKALSSIRLLKERRAALISAAVTGKIDVRREVKAQEQEAA